MYLMRIFQNKDIYVIFLLNNMIITNHYFHDARMNHLVKKYTIFFSIFDT